VQRGCISFELRSAAPIDWATCSTRDGECYGTPVHSLARTAAFGLLVCSLAVAGCSRGRDAKPLAPVGPPAIGGEWAEPPPSADPDAQGDPPLLLRAQDVDGRLDDRFGTDRASVPYLESDAWMGAAVPTVTMVAFIDYECPYSQRLAPTLYELVERYPNDLRVVLKHLPLDMHANARLAAEAAVVAQRRGRFWPMHDALFASQPNLQRATITTVAGRVGLSIPEMEADLDAHAGADAVARDLDLARAVGASGTPTSFINGRKLGGAQPFTEFAKVIDEELALAAELQAAGSARHELYARVLHAAARAEPAAPTPTKVAAGKPDPALSYAVPVQGRPVRGPENALVTIVMFADFQCPFSKRSLKTLEDVQKAKPRDVRIVFRHHPLAFHPQARSAAKATIAAGNQGKFWEMHDLVFEHQRELDDASWRRFAKKLKLKVDRFERDMKSEASERVIAEDEEVARRFGSNATPAFFVNGRFVSGAQPLDAFMRLVDEELPKAKAHSDAADSAPVYEILIEGFLPGVEPAPAAG
jgi:protein-disulfide isomerase